MKLEKENFDESQVLKDLKQDYSSAQASKTRVNNAIVGWLRVFNGDKYGNEVKGRSSIIIKDVKKAIKKMSPSIIQPFIASDVMIKTKPTTMQSKATASRAADVLNYQYNNGFDKLHFIRTIANVFPREGTIWVRTGWDFQEEEVEKTLEGLTSDDLASLKELGIEELEEVTANKDGTFNVTFSKKTTTVNRPTAIVCKNESIHADPTAERPEDCKFIIHEYEKTLSDIKKAKNIFSLTEEKEIAINKHLDDTNRNSDNPLGAKRYQDGLNNGTDLAFKFASKANKKVVIIEYWGEYDLEGNGTTQQIVCSWIKGSDIVLRLEENPYPDKKIPFVSEAYDLESFTIWGNAVADSIEDNQKIHTAIMRGFIDNLSLSNNGQKIFRKGAIDYINQQRLLNGEKIVEVNDIDGFKDGSFNHIPSATFDVYGMQDKEIEDLTGISKNLDGIDDATIGRTSSGVSQVMNAAQRHLTITVAVIANLYKKVFEKWNSYNQAYLDEEQAIEISGDLVAISKQEIAGNHSIEVQVNVDAMNQQKVQQINMLLQQAQGLKGQIPPETIPALVAEIFSSFGKEEMAESIRSYKPEPDPMQQQMMQLEMMKLQVEIEKYKAEAALAYSRSNNADAQADNHIAKKDGIDIDTLSKAQKMKLEEDSHGLDKEAKIADIETKYHDTAIKAQQASQKDLFEKQ